MIDDRTARESVLRFVRAIGRDAGFEPDRILDLLGPPRDGTSPNAGPLFRYASPLGFYSVSRKTGQVLAYSVTPPARALPPTVDRAAAERLAGQFVRTAYPGLERRVFEPPVVDERDDEFRVSYQEKSRPGEASIFRNFVAVNVRKDTGLVTNFGCSDLDFRRTTPPRIGDAEARERIGKEIKPLGGEIVSLDLVEEPLDEASRAVTVWSARVVFRDGVAQAADRILIDADTGERVFVS